ncbi:aldo/keto reductase [Halobellus captivus]|uniref:aldo/keto reductase n=1 Tax=Halobellus captivus TaxID=2592614 RepID=UPI0011A2A5B0|nr:aldo/keto reductase [Halobellus captivus]
MATSQGTWGYRDRFGDAFARTYFRRFGPGVASSIGLGTYLGEPTDARDERYRESIAEALSSGINVVDTAINYRHQRSERVVGEALRRADVDREEVVIGTKGGFIPFDGVRSDDPSAYVRREFLETGLLDTDDLARGSHAIAPEFLDAMLDRSLSNLAVDSVDCYYVHNPETQLHARPRDEVYDALEAAFERLERRRAADDIGGYGVATWEAFRVPRDHDSYLSLPEVVARAEAAAETVGVDDAGLIAVQLPFNVAMADAFTVSAHRHPTENRDVSALEYAQAAGIDVVASATLAQGQLASSIPDAVDAELRGDTNAQRAINFARSAPGVTTALVGTSSPEHVPENVAAGTFEPLGARAFDAVFE